MADRRLDGPALLSWAHACVGDLITHTDEINRLNVFPVADADTGTNMLFTMRSALAEASAAEAGAGPADIASRLARGALHGARGNSGMLLSQILRGLAEVTATDAAEVDGTTMASALRHAEGLMVSALGGEVVPGTIVSVLQAAAAAAEHGTAAGGPLGDVVAAAGDAAVVALEKTPDQLSVLAEAGVVDSGGRGLVVLLDALRATVTGYTPVRPAYEPRPAARSAAVVAPPPAQFEVMYLLAGCAGAAVDGLRGRLEALGDSVALAEALPEGGLSVHVHTDDAGAAVEAGLVYGTPSRIQISVLAATGKSAPGGFTAERAVLAVVDGDGAADLFAGEGAMVLRADTAIDARQLVRALIDTGAAQVMVLPNGYVAAEELVAGCTAAISWGIDVVPVPAGSMVHGLAALAVHDRTRRAVDDGYTMAAAAGATRYGSVRAAAEAALTWAGPCRVGDGLGIIGGEVLVVRHDITSAARGLIDLMLGVGGELVTVLLGQGAGPEIGATLAKHVHLHHPGTELVDYQTGHSGDIVIIGVE
ncbi:dihydroxyacetone kinase [Mycobacterium sp. MS1601]|uniref:DAK2 domain-containing protein n=1 Tax=Mycobacterium sp. MS1601 TaxID=1936029 RepID=UPI0009793997|nr:DAK2 domain-containing protein [Mycobacterium sp. MS1601]AQA06875.1 dihydroxyacetone kinase [Mycobacterium sp. MS1601]